MKTLTDSSEIREAVEMFDEFIEQSVVIAPPGPADISDFSTRPHLSPGSEPLSSVTIGMEIPPLEEINREERLESTLFSMCKRGGFNSAVVADSKGLPLAVCNSPVGDNTIAAFTSVLGDVLEKTAGLLKQNDANIVSIDINYTDKAVLRRFFISDTPHFLMIICPQEADERSEVELSIDQIKSILK